MTFTAVALFVTPAQTVTGDDATDGCPDGRRVEARVTVSTEKIVEEPKVEISTNGKIVGPAPQ